MGGGAQFASSGRGGAGNFVDSANSPKLQPQDLQTPTLKTNIVTTGRGGSGNMAPNKDPVETRARQDVEPVKRRESQGAQHSGRGGAGNVFKGDEAEQAKKAVNDNVIVEEQDKDKDKDSDKEKQKEKDKQKPKDKPKDEPKGLAAKGKAFLGLGKKD